MLKLHDYQKRAVDFVLKHKKVFLALDMGMGKTAIALETIKQSGKPAMVFGPLRPIGTTWPEEIAKWAPELTYRIIHGPQKSIHDIEDVDILLMNYEGLTWLSKQSAKWRKRTVIFDESSMVKSHSTARFKLLKKMRVMWNEYIICMSASPAPNSLMELWSQYYLLDQGEVLEKSISDFRNVYCRSFSYPGMQFVKYEVDPRYVDTIYKAVAPKTFRLAAEDYLDMPEITYNQIPCRLTPKLRKQYDELEKEFFIELDSTTEIEAGTAGMLANKLRQFVQGGIYYYPTGVIEELKNRLWKELHNIKLLALKELVETAAGQPILCAIQYKFELELIKAAFPKVPIIAGGTSAGLAQQLVTKWNAGDIPLLLCHPASLSHGVNLQSGGHTLLWYGLTWSLEQYFQLNGRLYRQGQKNHVRIHHLVMTDTIDEAVMQALETKDKNQQNLLGFLRSYRHDK